MRRTQGWFFQHFKIISTIHTCSNGIWIYILNFNESWTIREWIKDKMIFSMNEDLHSSSEMKFSNGKKWVSYIKQYYLKVRKTSFRKKKLIVFFSKLQFSWNNCTHLYQRKTLIKKLILYSHEWTRRSFEFMKLLLLS